VTDDLTPDMTGHPDELLAGYVDDSAPAEERAIVDEHLGSCARCREEVELARSARMALSALPEIEWAGSDPARLEAIRSAAAVERTLAPPLRLPEGRRARWERVAWSSGIAAALVLGVVFVALLFRSATSSTTPTAGQPGAVAGAPAPRPAIVDRGKDYTAAGLSALAAQLSQGGATDQSQSSARLSLRAAIPETSDSKAAITCVRQAGEFPANDRLIYLENASYLGRAAYIGAFFEPAVGSARSHLVVIAVSQGACQPLSEVRQAL
jgi:anti-sigma factor RsiW